MSLKRLGNHPGFGWKLLEDISPKINSGIAAPESGNNVTSVSQGNPSEVFGEMAVLSLCFTRKGNDTGYRERYSICALHGQGSESRNALILSAVDWLAVGPWLGVTTKF